jgi:hypothetical protein
MLAPLRRVVVHRVFESSLHWRLRARQIHAQNVSRSAATVEVQLREDDPAIQPAAQLKTKVAPQQSKASSKRKAKASPPPQPSSTSTQTSSGSGLEKNVGPFDKSQTSAATEFDSPYSWYTEDVLTRYQDTISECSLPDLISKNPSKSSSGVLNWKESSFDYITMGLELSISVKYSPLPNSKGGSRLLRARLKAKWGEHEVFAIGDGAGKVTFFLLFI